MTHSGVSLDADSHETLEGTAANRENCDTYIPSQTKKANRQALFL